MVVGGRNVVVFLARVGWAGEKGKGEIDPKMYKLGTRKTRHAI